MERFYSILIFCYFCKVVSGLTLFFVYLISSVFPGHSRAFNIRTERNCDSVKVLVHPGHSSPRRSSQDSTVLFKEPGRCFSSQISKGRRSPSVFQQPSGLSVCDACCFPLVCHGTRQRWRCICDATLTTGALTRVPQTEKNRG